MIAVGIDLENTHSCVGVFIQQISTSKGWNDYKIIKTASTFVIYADSERSIDEENNKR